jgi:hypothetical protein
MRVACAKVLAALTPLSATAIKRLLVRSNGRFAYEVHFSLFVFMADVEEFNGGESLVLGVIQMLSDYLDREPSETARAAWMAAHALGGRIKHLAAKQALLKLIRGAHYAVGRRAAVMGLGEWLREGATPKARRAYVKLLASAAADDRSESVRSAARVAIMRLKERATQNGSRMRPVGRARGVR